MTVTTTLTPAMSLDTEDGVLSGTVALAEKTGKNVTRALTFAFDGEPAEISVREDGDLEAEEGGQIDYDPMPPSSLSQNEPAGEENSAYLVGQPPIGYQTYEVPETMQTYDLDTAQRQQLEALRAELVQNLAGRLLAALAGLPAEDTALLSDNMSDEDYAAFLALLEQ